MCRGWSWWRSRNGKAREPSARFAIAGAQCGTLLNSGDLRIDAAAPRLALSDETAILMAIGGGSVCHKHSKAHFV